MEYKILILPKNYLSALITTFCLLPFILLSQNSKKNIADFEIYMDVGKMDSNFYNFIEERNFLINERLTMSMINPKQDGCAQLDIVKKYIDIKFPEKLAEGVCVIDWEGKAISNLKKFTKGDNTEVNQMQEYIKIVDTMKAMRPNLKIGIYNIPFRNYSKDKVAFNPYDYTRLYPLLRKTDIINPSPYKPYSVAQVGEKSNNKYFEDYIQQALRIKNDINKPVLAYIAMRYYNANSPDNKKLIPPQEFKADLKHMLKTKVDGKNIDGFILWNGDRWSFEDKLEKKNEKNENNLKNKFLDQHFLLLRKYSLIIDSLNVSNH
jgi:hypothetical protein